MAASTCGDCKWPSTLSPQFSTTLPNPAHRQLPLAHLRPHLLRHHHQLRRSPDHRRPRPTLKQELNWSQSQYGDIVFYFQTAYAIGLLLSGPIIDRIGTKLGYALSLLIWSLAAVAHALVRTVSGFSIARFALGLGEAGNFPAAIKTVAEWFPKRERALATGIFNAGTNVGAIVAPLVVPGSPSSGAGTGPFSSPAAPASSGSPSGSPCITTRANTNASPPRSRLDRARPP